MNMQFLFLWNKWVLIEKPITVALIFFILAFLVLFFINLYYLISGTRKLNSLFPRGHLSFWMVSIFDIFIIPISGYITATFYQLAVKEGMTMIFNHTIEIVSFVVSFCITWIIIKQSRYSGEANWSNKINYYKKNVGLNLAGLYHFIIQVYFIHYFTYFIAIGFQIWNHEPYFNSFILPSLVLLSFAIPFEIIDILDQNKSEFWPNVILSKLFLGKKINI